MDGTMLCNVAIGGNKTTR